MKTKNKVLVASVFVLLAIFAIACTQTTGKSTGLNGLVTVTTNPAGALIVLTPKDGGNVLSLGETPVINRRVPVGGYVLSITKEGYKSFSMGIVVRGATPVEISESLTSLEYDVPGGN